MNEACVTKDMCYFIQPSLQHSLPIKLNVSSYVTEFLSKIREKNSTDLNDKKDLVFHRSTKAKGFGND
jgi:hypothetical protein